MFVINETKKFIRLRKKTLIRCFLIHITEFWAITDSKCAKRFNVSASVVTAWEGKGILVWSHNWSTSGKYTQLQRSNERDFRCLCFSSFIITVYLANVASGVISLSSQSLTTDADVFTWRWVYMLTFDHTWHLVMAIKFYAFSYVHTHSRQTIFLIWINLIFLGDPKSIFEKIVREWIDKVHFNDQSTVGVKTFAVFFSWYWCTCEFNMLIIRHPSHHWFGDSWKCSLSRHPAGFLAAWSCLSTTTYSKAALCTQRPTCSSSNHSIQISSNM